MSYFHMKSEMICKKYCCCRGEISSNSFTQLSGEKFGMKDGKQIFSLLSVLPHTFSSNFIFLIYKLRDLSEGNKGQNSKGM